MLGKYDLVLPINTSDPSFLTHHSKIIFSGGETHINLNQSVTPGQYKNVLVRAHINSAETLMETIHVLDALRWRGISPDLFLPYFPYSRADRLVGNGGGDSFGLALFADMLYGLCDEIITLDMHSTKGMEVVCNRVDAVFVNIIPYEIFINTLVKKHNMQSYCLVSPDEGAEQKVALYAEKLKVPHFKIKKVRDQEKKGKIVKYEAINEFVPCDHAIILDDICDGGATFLMAASCIPRPTKLHLGVTHGIFSKGLSVLWYGGFESVITTDSFAQHKNAYKDLHVIGVDECLKLRQGNIGL